jgi:hypothetical protein
MLAMLWPWHSAAYGKVKLPINLLNIFANCSFYDK